jgi:SAM-dependent methyltransferase
MSEPPIQTSSEFDAYAAEYDAQLARGISISGEDKNYFARGRVVWLARCLARLQKHPRTALDFGCGTGSATPFLLNQLKLNSLVGVDASVQSLEIARRTHGDRARFIPLAEYRPEGSFDLVFCNGVFHHISPCDRVTALDTIYSSLRPGGVLAFWENNPWNLGTRYIMRRIPFDRNASTLSPPAAQRLLRKRGLEAMRIDFLFFFPRFLAWLRWLEPGLIRLPLGAQYQVLCQKPEEVLQTISETRV